MLSNSVNLAIVVPAFNAAPYLNETLTSVAAQTRSDWRCVVVDDGSDDDTAAVARAFVATDTRFTVVEQLNAGVAAARNRGALEVGSELLLFLDADDLLEPEAVELLLRALDVAPEAVAAHGRASVIDSAGAESDQRGHEQDFGRQTIRRRGGTFSIPRIEDVAPTEPTTLEMLLLRNPITTPGQVVVRRWAFDRTGGFDSRVEPAEDWSMWIDLAQLGPLSAVPNDVLRYRRHDAGASANLSRMRSAELRVRHRAMRCPAPVSNADDRSGTVGSLARTGLRATEWRRAQDRLASARRTLSTGEVREAGRDLLRCGSSLAQIARSVLPMPARLAHPR